MFFIVDLVGFWVFFFEYMLSCQLRFVYYFCVFMVCYYKVNYLEFKCEIIFCFEGVLYEDLGSFYDFVMDLR